MDVTRLGHAALLVETPRTRVLIDPGRFSREWHGLDDLDGVLITHQHADHVDAEGVSALLASNRQARVVVEPAVLDMLDVDDTERAVVGETVTVGNLAIEVVGGEHAVIHPRIPRVGNVGFVISEDDGPRLFHPGDSYDTVPEGVDVLALPITAPWTSVGPTVDFVAAVAPGRMFPIHDAIVSQAGRPVFKRIVTNLSDDSIAFHDPPTGDTFGV